MRRLSWACATFTMVMALAGAASAAVPPTLTHQGRLYDDTGAPVSASLEVTFAIYDAVNGDTALWTETHTVTFEDGYFSVSLGADTPFGALFDGKETYLGIKVGNNAEMTPRSLIASVPFAFLAGDVNGDIHPTSVSIAGFGEVIDKEGSWVGPSSGLEGPEGPQGPAGTVGPTGPAGSNGAQGVPGPQGAVGPTGPPGPIGPIGPQPPPGPPGPTGPAGPIGPQGAQGIQGPAGAQGIQGAIGPVGPQGATGPQGVTGAVGPTGPAGAQGLVGPQGPAGVAGPQGATGGVGPIGLTGATGPQFIISPWHFIFAATPPRRVPNSLIVRPKAFGTLPAT